MTKATISKQQMTEFAHLLVNQMGLHYPKEQWQDLEKKILRVMRAFGFFDPSTFLQWVKEKSPLTREQITLFAQHLTIGETYFFRDDRTFAALREKIFPSLFKHHQFDQNIRIWCAGCCTGEEPYSIAILLHQMMTNWKNWKIEIFGTDINADFLKKAEQGIYKRWSFRTTSDEIIQKYFIQRTETTYELIPEIKKSVKFSYLNLVDDIYPSRVTDIHDIDLILCHNVLIYFSQSQITKVIHRLSQTLKEHAWLSVSAIEAPFVSGKYLVSCYFSGAFLFQKESKAKIAKHEVNTELPVFKKNGELGKDEILLKTVFPTFLHSFPSQSSLDISFSKENNMSSPLPKKSVERESQNLYKRSLELSHHKQYDAAITQLTSYLLSHQQDPSFISQHLKEIILLIQIYANQGNTIQALEWIEIALRSDKLNPIFHYLHGTVLHSLGDITNGIKSLKRALFLDSNFVVAHYMLGMFEQQQKHEKAALRHFKIALDLLQNYKEEEILPGTEDLSAGSLKNLLLDRVH